MSRCVYCAEEIQDAAIVCKHCGRPVPAGAEYIDHQGNRYALGRTSDSYAIWDISKGGSAAVTFPVSDEGWADAWNRFQQVEQIAPLPAGQPQGGYYTHPSGASQSGPIPGRNLTIISWVCSALAVLFVPIVLGPAAMILGAVAKNKGDPKGGQAILIGLVATVVGIGLGILVLTQLKGQLP